MSEELTQKIKTNLLINRRLCLKVTHIISDFAILFFFLLLFKERMQDGQSLTVSILVTIEQFRF